jgi:hypothetical protein
MKPVRLSRTGMRNQLYSAYRPGYRVPARQRLGARMPHRVAARLRPGMRFWSRPPDTARLLFTLLGRILKFHESEPMLSRQPITGNC